MQAPRGQNVEVVIPVKNGHGSAIATNGAQHKRPRPLSVDEALQYSPFTTSVSAGHGRDLTHTASQEHGLMLPPPDRISIPQVGQASSHLSLTTSAERKNIRRTLQDIRANPTNDHNGAKSLQDVGFDVDKLLDGDAISELYVAPSCSWIYTPI